MSVTDIERTPRFAATEGVRRRGDIEPGGRLVCRPLALLDAKAGVDTLASMLSDLVGNDEGGTIERRIEVVEGVGLALPLPPGVDVALETLRLLGTTVVRPLAALESDAMEDVLGLVPPDDVPAAVERDVVIRDMRDGVSDGGLDVI